MALSNENGMVMPVSPMYGGGYGGGSGFFGGDWAWIILLLLIGGNGWGFGGYGMGGMMGMMPWMMGGMNGFGLDYLYPWLNNSQHISDGFRGQQLNTQIGDLRSDVNRGFGDVQLGISGLGRQICETGNGITGAVRDGFYGAEIAANNRQMANMQQGFGIQNSITTGFAGAAAGTADLKYTIADEACKDRAAVTAGIQTILDKLCQLELDGVKRQYADEQRENANLRTELMYARGQASQVAQTSQIVDNVYNRLSQCPVNTVSVYGNQPVFRCAGPTTGNNCGCGNGNF